MKYKIFLILLSVLFFLSYETKISYAAEEVNSIELNQQVQALKEKIKYLQRLIANLKLEKEISAESYLVLDVSNNSVILEKNIHQIYPIASITKLMNAVITAENIKDDQSIIITGEMLEPQGYSPSLFLDLNITAKNLLKASLIQSTNDAAESLSYVLGNKKFLDLMNKKAKELGMRNTHFYDVHGLSPNNNSTALELAKLLVYINKNHPQLWSITKDNDFWLPDQTGRSLKFKNVNNFYELSEFTGGKAGYLPEAKQSLASIFNVNKKPVTIILLRSKNRQTDTIKILDWLKNDSAVKSILN